MRPYWCRQNVAIRTNCISPFAEDRSMGKKNRLNHVEFRTRDVARLRAFYGALFGWKFKSFGDSYTMIDFGNEEVQGGVDAIGADSPLQPGVSQFFVVDDL